ncbi:OmpH family outer membrane protein [Aquaticitalea lipolytica]|nr:OmpH family outer membrane protein [Aquaticitalea lipolytica]
MKKILFVVFALLMLASCKNEMKTGFIDNSKLINDYQKKKDIESDFDKKTTAFNKKVDSIRTLFQQEAALIQSTDPNVAKKASQEKMQMLGQQFQVYQQQWQSEEQQLAKEGQTKIDTLIKEVRTFVKDYGKKNGYSFILGSNEAGSVLYGEEGKDLTNVILEELNKAYKKD